MYGTCAKTRVAPENRAALQEIVSQHTSAEIPGFISSYTLFENDSDVLWMFAVFEDRESYDRNADDPRQHERYTQYRALMLEEPEWHDGQILAT
jgi:quinol monooxygenase YgiN